MHLEREAVQPVGAIESEAGRSVRGLEKNSLVSHRYLPANADPVADPVRASRASLGKKAARAKLRAIRASGTNRNAMPRPMFDKFSFISYFIIMLL
jgi:hypothetical protein